LLAIHPRTTLKSPVLTRLAALAALGCAGLADAGDLVADLAAQAPGADPKVIELAVLARECAGETGQLLAVADYSKPSLEQRLWVFDLAQRKLLFAEHVAHGQGTGENLAQRFSNRDGSHQTSLGLFRTAETYVGGNGYSLRMDGLEPGFNDRARERAIVMHGAWYVNPAAAQTQGRLGRSHGCPAVRADVAKSMIDTLKGGNLLFSYYPDGDWLAKSKLVACANTRLAAKTGAGAAAAGAAGAP
jgi:hypothetical protein